LQAATREVRLRVKRVLANLEPITQQHDPILTDPRAVWLDITLSNVELESVTLLMKRGVVAMSYHTAFALALVGVHDLRYASRAQFASR
jgi:hypothetical protein